MGRDKVVEVSLRCEIKLISFQPSSLVSPAFSIELSATGEHTCRTYSVELILCVMLQTVSSEVGVSGVGADHSCLLWVESCDRLV